MQPIINEPMCFIIDENNIEGIFFLLSFTSKAESYNGWLIQNFDSKQQSFFKKNVDKF